MSPPLLSPRPTAAARAAALHHQIVEVAVADREQVRDHGVARARPHKGVVRGGLDLEVADLLRARMLLLQVGEEGWGGVGAP